MAKSPEDKLKALVSELKKTARTDKALNTSKKTIEKLKKAAKSLAKESKAIE